MNWLGPKVWWCLFDPIDETVDETAKHVDDGSADIPPAPVLGRERLHARL
jgi:hypothetical protein